jgi:RND family efflux transporter MFP subunit
MKKILFILVVIFLTGCASSENDQTKREELKNLNTELLSIQKRINQIEKELGSNGVPSSNESIAVPVTVKELQTESFNHYFEVSGAVEAAKSAFISPELNGQIQKIYVEEGQRVKKGDLLAKINTSVLESNISGIETGLNLATVVFEKQQKLWDKNIGSEIDYLTAKNAKEGLEDQLASLNAQLELAYIKAPFNGIIDNILQKEGDLASPGMQLLQLVNLDKIYINADVAETYLPVIKKGDKVDLSFPVFPEIELKEPIYRISNIIHPQNRTVKMQLRINNKNEMLKPNGMAIIRINDFSSDEALVVPSIVIKQDMTGSFLYIATKDNAKWIAKKRYVKTGASYLDQSLITEGVVLGERVIIEGYNQVSDGSVVKIR